MIELKTNAWYDVAFDIETTSLHSWEGRITAIGVKTQDGEIIFMYKDEKETLLMFWEYLRGIKGLRLISFNGKNFDIPFLICRSLKHRISVVQMQWHLDLRYLLSGSYNGKGKLDDYAGLLDLHKNGNGAQAIQFWEQQQLEQLKKYLLEDLRITWQLFQKLKEIGWVK